MNVGENRRGNQEWVIHRKPKTQLGVNNPETRAALCTKHKTKKKKHNTEN